MAKKNSKAASDHILHLDPAQIYPSDNIRHGVRQADVDRMIASIIDRGGIQEPVSVEAREVPDGEPPYVLIKGFIRHAAAVQMNITGAGIKVPAIVREPQEAVEKLKTQVAENVARATLSPIDTAHSIRRLLEAGTSRMDIRALFAKAGPGGMKPMSNSWVNLHLSMLDFPADVIDKIHNGEVTYTAAYELSRVPEERRAAVLESALAEVRRAEERDERDEVKLLKQEQAAHAEEERIATLAAQVEAAKQAVADAEELEKQKLIAYRAAQAVKVDPEDEDARKAHDEGLAAAETEVKAMKKIVKTAANKVAKLMTQKSKAEALKEELTDASAGPDAVGPAAVKRAAVKDKETAEGKAAMERDPTGGSIPLTAAQVRDGIKEMAKGTENPLVSKVLGIFSDFCYGALTPKLALADFEKTLKLKAPPKPTA